MIAEPWVQDWVVSCNTDTWEYRRLYMDWYCKIFRSFYIYKLLCAQGFNTCAVTSPLPLGATLLCILSLEDEDALPSFHLLILTPWDLE